MTQVFAHNPQTEFHFYSRKVGGFIVRTRQRYLSNRTLADPVATAQIVLRDTVIRDNDRSSLNGRSYADILQSNDLCTVKMMGRDGVQHTDIIGVVKKVEVFEIELSGEPEHRTEIRVEGIGSELANYRIFWHPHVAGRQNLGGMGFRARSNGKIPKGKPHEVVEGLFDTFMNDEYVFQFADGENLKKKIDFRPEPDSISHSRIALSALGMEGALWETMKRYADQPWMELFVDVQHERSFAEISTKKETGAQSGFTSSTKVKTDYSAFFNNQSSLHGKVGVYHRPTPFTLDRWQKLSQSKGWGFSFDEEERIDDGYELARDISKIYSFFFVPAKALLSGFDQLGSAYDQSNGLLPLYDADLVKRFGFRDLTQATEYVQYITAGDQSHGKIETSQFSLWELLAIRTLQLYQWHGYPEFWEGVLTVAGRIGPDSEKGVRIGSVITHRGTGWQYYVTGIQQVDQFPGQHITRITVERGRDQKKYSDWWATKMSGKYNSKLSNMFPQYILERLGLWPKGRDLKIPDQPAMAGDFIV